VSLDLQPCLLDGVLSVRTSVATLVSDINFTTDIVRFKIILDAVTIAISAAEAARAAAFNAGINAEAARVAFTRVHHSRPDSDSDSNRSANNRSLGYYANRHNDGYDSSGGDLPANDRSDSDSTASSMEPLEWGNDEPVGFADPDGPANDSLALDPPQDDERQPRVVVRRRQHVAGRWGVGLCLLFLLTVVTPAGATPAIAYDSAFAFRTVCTSLTAAVEKADKGYDSRFVYHDLDVYDLPFGPRTEDCCFLRHFC
jgi:hypothetical protein